MDGDIVQTLSSGECSELAGTSTSPTITFKNNRLDDVSAIEAKKLDTTAAPIMLFNNGHVVTVMETSSIMDNTLQMTIQQTAVSNHDPLEQYISDTTNACQDNMLATHIHSVVLPSTNTTKHSSTFEVSVFGY